MNKLHISVRYILVGSIAFLLYYTAIKVGLAFQINQPISIIISITVATLFQYLSHSWFTFRSVIFDIYQMARFIATVGFGTVVSTIFLWIVPNSIPYSTDIALFLSASFLAAVNFFIYRYWVFPNGEPELTKSYDSKFFDYIDRRAIRSANEIVPILYGAFLPKSVLDIGCGRGSWLQAWEKQDPELVIHGLDGAYVDLDKLYVDRRRFQAHNLLVPFRLNRKFDLVTSFETAEHLDPDRSESLVNDLCLHGDMVLFSAAQPGQGGEHHVNERPLRYWIDIFSRCGYEAFDIRWLLTDAPYADPWYRYNMMLYVKADMVDQLASELRDQRVIRDTDLNKLVSYKWRLRLTVGSCLPTQVSTFIAKALSYWHAHAYR